MSMSCPDCGHATSRVVDSRPINGGTAIRRRRECQRCGFRFTTYERTEWDIQVKKRDGTIEPFDRAKVRVGLQRAVEKRPVTDEQVEELIEDVEREFRDADTRIVPSTEIGDRVSEDLRELDKVAYLRFVSVYQAFSDPEEFRRELDEVLDGGMNGDANGDGNGDANENRDGDANGDGDGESATSNGGE